MMENATPNWSDSPDKGNQLIEQGILQTIADHLVTTQSDKQAQELLYRIAERRDAIVKEHAPWVVDGQSQGHLFFSALMLAGYQVLQSIIPKDEVLDLLRRAFVEPVQEAIQKETRTALDSAADPFTTLTQISKEREMYYYGSTFSFDRIQDDAYAYLVNIHRCFYHTFLVANGAAELMPILCDWDTMTWGRAIEPARHGFRFERPTTLGYGDNMCRFWFIRTTKKGADE